MNDNHPFYTAYRGRFSNLLSWEQLDGLWLAVRRRADAGWYLYAVGEVPPTRRADAAEVERFVAELDTLLRRDHDEDYCGIVYADAPAEPTFIKIFDPHHLGSSCGSSKNPPAPGWVMSLIPPAPLEDGRIIPNNRKRWWQQLWD